MAKKKIDIEKIVTHLIGLSKERGYITFHEMNESLPNVVNTEQIDTIMEKLWAVRISIRETEDDLEDYGEDNFNKKLEESIQVIKNPLSKEQRLFLVDLAKLPSKESKLTVKERINLYTYLWMVCN